MSETARKSEKRLLDVGELEGVAIEVARFLDEKRAEDIAILRVRELLPISSFFVIASATSTRGAQTLSDGTERLLKPKPIPRLGVHGRTEGRWICLDYSELVIHIFEKDTRRFYDLENLWAGAPRVKVEFPR